MNARLFFRGLFTGMGFVLGAVAGALGLLTITGRVESVRGTLGAGYLALIAALLVGLSLWRHRRLRLPRKDGSQ
ncbi:MAG: hypothetical protein JNK72_25040 [Myxococcales bacterium]|nr:hypothetical protein [Myxococcales bacterium]